MNDELKHLSPTQNAARIVFAFGITALVVILVYFGILWLDSHQLPYAESISNQGERSKRR
jgi:hypothetical protein